MKYATVFNFPLERESDIRFSGDEAEFDLCTLVAGVSVSVSLSLQCPTLQFQVPNITHFVNDDRVFVLVLVPGQSESGRSPFRGGALDQNIGNFKSRTIRGVAKVDHNQTNFDLHSIDYFFGKSVLGRSVRTVKNRQAIWDILN